MKTSEELRLLSQEIRLWVKMNKIFHGDKYSGWCAVWTEWANRIDAQVTALKEKK